MRARFLLLLLMAMAIVSIFAARRPSGEESELVRFLNKRYNGQFSARSRSVGHWLITEAHADPIRTTDFIWDEVFGDVAPTVVIQPLDSKTLHFVYEISSAGTDWPFNPFLKRWETVNLDDDTDYEVVGEWGLSSGGAGGFKGLVAFDTDGAQFRPVAGFPMSNGGWMMKFSDLSKKGNSYEFPSVNIWSLTRYEDVNGDGKDELLYGDFIWDLDAGESRNAPHIWNLSVFQLEGNHFVPASWWNNGQTLRTTEKIQEDEQKLLEIFREISGQDFNDGN